MTGRSCPVVSVVLIGLLVFESFPVAAQATGQGLKLSRDPSVSTPDTGNDLRLNGRSGVTPYYDTEPDWRERYDHYSRQEQVDRCRVSPYSNGCAEKNPTTRPRAR